MNLFDTITNLLISKKVAHFSYIETIPSIEITGSYLPKSTATEARNSSASKKVLNCISSFSLYIFLRLINLKHAKKEEYFDIHDNTDNSLIILRERGARATRFHCLQYI